MKHKYVMLVAVLVAAMFIMIAYSSVDNNSYITNANDIKSNNSYVKIRNIALWTILLILTMA